MLLSSRDCGSDDDPDFSNCVVTQFGMISIQNRVGNMRLPLSGVPPTDNGLMSTYIFLQLAVIDRNLLCSVAIIPLTKEVKGASDISLENFAD